LPFTAERRPTPDETTASDGLTLGPVHLDVSSADASLRFWQEAVGLELLSTAGGAFHLGAGARELVVLHPDAAPGGPVSQTGLYHLALHLPDESEFARSLLRLDGAGVQTRPTDHVMHWANYVWDPDGNGLEVSFETFDRFDRYEFRNGRPMVIDADGRLRSGVEPLDLQHVLSHLDDHDLRRPLRPGVRVGHVHLKVADIDGALAYYVDLIGFAPNVLMPALGAADLHAGGTFPHRLAFNTWESHGAGPRADGTAGLRHFTVAFRHAQAHADAVRRIREAGGVAQTVDAGVRSVDPAGNTLLLAVDDRS
jgi:catechol 2,3-dioxygenase